MKANSGESFVQKEDLLIWHGWMLLWFNECYREVTIHRPNVSTLLLSAFIRGDLNAATRCPFMRSLTSDRIKGPRVIELSTNKKVFSIVKNISGQSKIYLEWQNYFSANKIILDHFCSVWLSIFCCLFMSQSN